MYVKGTLGNHLYFCLQDCRLEVSVHLEGPANRPPRHMFSWFSLALSKC
jgi:hypothetical protein